MFEVTKDTFTPYLNELCQRFSDSGMKTFMESQVPTMVNNVHECFNKEVYFDGTTIRNQPSHSPFTEELRKKKETWHGSGRSMLKEYGNMQRRLVSNISVSSKHIKLSSSNPIDLATVEGSPDIPQTRPPRYPYSFLPETIKKLTNSARKLIRL